MFKQKAKVDTVDRANYELFDFKKLMDMPAPRVKRCKGDAVARVLLRCPQSETGEADLYVHIKCVEYAGGDGMYTKFNILLIDDECEMVLPKQNSNGTWTGYTKTFSADDVIRMAEATKKYYNKYENNHITRGIPDAVPLDVLQREDSQYSMSYD